MKNTILIFLAILSTQLAFSQEQNEKPTEYDVNARKGQFFASWGWNRSSYGISDITFCGNDFDFPEYPTFP